MQKSHSRPRRQKLRRGELEVATLELHKDELTAIPATHLAFYLQVGQFMNEIAMLQSLLVRTINGMNTGPRPVQETNLAMVLFLTRSLCGRVYEAHKAINLPSNRQILAELWDAPPATPQALEVRANAELGWTRLNKKLGPKSSLLRLVRNKLAYHLDESVLMKSFEAIPASYRLADFHTGIRGTTFFGVADTVVALAVGHLTSPDDVEAGVEQMASVALSSVLDLQDFGDGFLLAFYLAYIGEDRLEQAPSETLTGLPDLGRARLGFYLSSALRTGGAVGGRTQT